MKHPVLVLMAMLLAAGTSHSDEGARLVYRDPSGRLALTVSQAMEVHASQTVEAARELSFALTLASAPAGITVTIDEAKASAEAHGMNQRLNTRHLTGKTLTLSIADGGRRLAVGSDSALAIDLGPMVDGGGYSLAGLLADILPVLPDKPVARGDTWSTETPLRSIEGWAWASGTLASRHRVTAIEKQGAATLVTVETEATSSLAPIEGQRTYRGELKRKLRWTFDATAGRVTALTLEQDSDGVSDLMDKDSKIHQHTKIVLAP